MLTELWGRFPCKLKSDSTAFSRQSCMDESCTTFSTTGTCTICCRGQRGFWGRNGVGPRLNAAGGVSCTSQSRRPAAREAGPPKATVPPPHSCGPRRSDFFRASFWARPLATIQPLPKWPQTWALKGVVLRLASWGWNFGAGFFLGCLVVQFWGHNIVF